MILEPEVWEPVREVPGMSFEDIREGGHYVYTASYPPHATGQRYLVRQFIQDVPSYQPRILIQCMSGKDKGILFVSTFNNFRIRYTPFVEAAEKIAAAVEPKVLNLRKGGSNW